MCLVIGTIRVTLRMFGSSARTLGLRLWSADSGWRYIRRCHWRLWWTVKYRRWYFKRRWFAIDGGSQGTGGLPSVHGLNSTSSSHDDQARVGNLHCLLHSLGTMARLTMSCQGEQSYNFAGLSRATKRRVLPDS